MLTQNDIQKITNAQIAAQKEIFFTREEIDARFANKDEINEKFSSLQMSVDAIARNNHTADQERASLAERMKNAEDIIDKIAPKVGLNFKN